MPLLSDWNDHQGELEAALKDLLQKKVSPPKDVVALLKTKDLKEALALADGAKTNENIDDARSAQAKTQKFFLMYANQYKAAMDATKDVDDLADLRETLMMFNVYMTRTQVAVARLADALIQEAKKDAADDAKTRELEVKSALSPLKFKYDWKAAKQDFEKETGKKKPSETVLGVFRKSAGLDNALDDLDKACQDADPAAYRKAYPTFVKASADYAKSLNTALASDKAADEVYKKKCGGLKDLLSSIGGRAKEKLTLLDKLNV